MIKKRSYTLRKRAQSQEETRRRIVEAAVQLHENVGPRATTISAIAEKAGVQRLTVYRHFPDEAAVFQACSSHWLSLNPPPDPAEWMRLSDELLRVRKALKAFYRYYRGTEQMWVAVHRDEALVPALQGPMGEFRRLVRTAADGLLEAFGPGAGKALTATVRHALAFPTWTSLKQQGLDDAAMVDLACRWIFAARTTPDK
jgi:AcrR family transcriptional regulator